MPPLLSRRQLLQSLGATLGAGMVPSVARADAGPPLRILFLVSGHGTVHDAWRPGGALQAGDTTLDLPTLSDEAPPILEPLWDKRDKLMVLEGVGNPAAIVSGIFAHSAGTASCQTGRIPLENTGGAAFVDGPSLDQVIAEAQDTPFKSLEWAVGGGAPVVYDALGQVMPSMDDPVEVFRRLFPTAAGTLRPQESATIGDWQGPLLTRLAGRCDALPGRVQAADQAKMARHCELLGDLEARIHALAAIDCTHPAEPVPPQVDSPLDADFHTHQMSAFVDLAAAAFACDLTRVITLRVDQLPTAAVGAPPGDLHFDWMHDDSPQAIGYAVEHHLIHARRVRQLIDALDAIPEGDGTLLDHTLVVWHNELATGNHALHSVPVVLAGATHVIQSGTYRRWAPQHRFAGRLSDEIVGRPYNQLLTTLGVAMGLDIDHFGEPEIERYDGTMLDCTGLLDGVLR